MDTSDAIREMIARSGKSARALSAEMGKSPSYLGTTLAKGSDVSAANLARLADRCGYELVLMGNDEKIKIDPAE